MDTKFVIHWNDTMLQIGTKLIVRVPLRWKNAKPIGENAMLYNGYRLKRCNTTGNYSVIDPRGNKWSDSFCNIQTAKKYVHLDINDKRAIAAKK